MDDGAEQAVTCSSARSDGPINASGHGNAIYNIHCLVIIPVYSSMTTLKINTSQEFSRRSVTAEVRVRSHVCPCGICGGRIGTGTGSSRSISELPYQNHSTKAS
jgi:hypothetical protein